MVHKLGEGTDSVLSAMRQEYKERGIDWAPITGSLLSMVESRALMGAEVFRYD
jgi:hypothetical protein